MRETIPVSELEDVRVLQFQAPRSSRGVLQSSYDGQSYDDLPASLGDRLGSPSIEVLLVTVRNGFLCMKPGFSGLVLTADRRPVFDTTLSGWDISLFDESDLADSAVIQLDRPVCPSICASWGNFYHWVVLGLGRAALVEPFLEPECDIVFPDYDAYLATGSHMGISREVWARSLEALNLTRVPRFLPPGVYRAPEIRFVTVRSTIQPFLTFLSSFCQPLARIGEARRKGLTRKALISRPHDPRLPAQTALDVQEIAQARGFEIVALETMSFDEQVDLFANAQQIVAPHGAGLTGLLFGSPRLRILELNSDLDNGNYVRPWFYVIAQGMNQTYRYLNGSLGGFSRDRLEGAFDRLNSGP